MKSYSRIWTVYRKELTETLRDRRTLMAMVFVPVILYPILMVVLMQALSSEKGRQEESEYTVVVPNEAHKRWLETILLREDEEVNAEQKALDAAAKAMGEEMADPTGRAAFRTRLGSKQIHIVIADDPGKIWDIVAAGAVHAGVVVRPDPAVDRAADPNRVVQILYSDTNPLSEVIFRQLNLILQNEAGRIVRDRVTKLAGTPEVLNPIMTTNLSTTSPDKQFSKVLALIVPFLLVTMTVTGAMYPAIDLTAGERERGTLETLAVSPVPVGQIVAGKFGVIVTIAMVTTALNLGSMTAVIQFSGIAKMLGAPTSASAAMEEMEAEQTVQSAPAEPGSSAALQRINFGRRQALEQETNRRAGFVTTAAPIVLLAMIPFAVLFGGVMLAVCSFAKSFKEAQNYMMPVMMSAIVPAMVVSYMPTIELQGPLMATPVANVVLLMRELFLGNFRIEAVVIVLLSTCLYAAAAVAMATRIYGNEAVLFNDVGSYKTLLLRKFMRPQRVPSAAFALLTLALIFPVNFFVQSSIVTADSGWMDLCRAVGITQVLLFFGVVVFLAWYAKLNMRETFSLRLPSALHWVATLLIVAGIVPLSATIQQYLYATFPPTSQMQQMMQAEAKLLSGIPLWAIVAFFAILPGVCEEFAFRGMLLTGLRDRIGTWRTVLVVGIVFGAFHIYVHKIPPIAIVGMLLAYVCIRTGSILPGILIHIANNGVGLIADSMVKANDPRLMDLFGLPHGDEQTFDYSVNPRTMIFIAAVVLGLAIMVFTPKRPTPRSEPRP
ncbi:MAG: CPBP family intramembrane metalloprotease [Phycisphaerales bacterium]|nr:CPBP family intramembrane metalloprotease [Phycisphaerales bacterium]MCB9862160.1 CPBP family intramembrane metalloprotease [Phycisphaerales bacterium]